MIAPCIKIYKPRLSPSEMRQHIRVRSQFVTKSDLRTLKFVCSLLKKLRNYNFSVFTLSHRSEFKMLDRKLYLYLTDVNSFESERLLRAIDRYRLRVENYNVNSGKIFLSWFELGDSVNTAAKQV